MKKLKLRLQNMEGVEVLTREQLKKVMGGSGGSGQYCINDQQCHYEVGINYLCNSNGCTYVGPDDPTGCLQKPMNEQCSYQHKGCCPSGRSCEYSGDFGYRCI